MSGVVKGVKKAFKKVVDVGKKIAKPVAIAAAVYFTGGLALSAFPATASFAASMPGFAGGGFLGTGVGAGATAGTGLFSKAAAAMGLGGGLAKGAVAKGAADIGALSAIHGASAVGAAQNAAIAGNAGAMASGGTTAALAKGGAAMAGGAKAASMSLADKLMLASVGTQALGAFMAPSVSDEYREAAKWRGAYYGANKTGPLVQMPLTPSPEIGARAGLLPPSPAASLPPSPTAPSRGSFQPAAPGQSGQKPAGLIPMEQVAALQAPDQGLMMKQNPKVRYVT